MNHDRVFRGPADFAAKCAVSLALTAVCGIVYRVISWQAHFPTDAATARMSLGWPVTDAPMKAPYRWYVVALLLIVPFPPTQSRKVVSEENPPRMSWGSGDSSYSAPSSGFDVPRDS